jgi:hypothetical protein
MMKCRSKPAPTKNYAAAGTYTITLQATSNRNCVASASQVIIVYNLPDATIRPLGASAFCDGDSLVLSAGSLLDSFEWSSAEITRTIIVTTAGNYSVTVTSQYGCVASDDIDIVYIHYLLHLPETMLLSAKVLILNCILRVV